MNTVAWRKIEIFGWLYLCPYLLLTLIPKVLSGLHFINRFKD